MHRDARIFQPAARRILHVLTAALAFLAAGCPGDPPPDTTPIPGGGAWRSFARVPVPLHESGGVVYDGRLYMIGGRLENGPVSTLWRYDPATDAWTQLASHPGTPVDHMNVAEVDGILYAIGGTIEWPGPSVDGVYAYDPATNIWTSRRSAPRPIAVSGTGVVNGRIYVIGGLSGGQAVNTVMEYDPSTDTWADLTPVSPMPTARDHFMAGVIDGRIYCPGGRQVAINNGVNAHEVFDPTMRTWSTAAQMPTPRAGYIGVVLGDEFLAIGGEGAGTAGGGLLQK